MTIGILIDPGTIAGTAIEVMWFDDANNQWQPLEGSTIIGSTVFARTDHFSVFAILPGAAACDNLWSGGPGNVVPMLVPGNITVSPATRTDEVIQFSAPARMAVGSSWVSDACSVTVSGNYGPGLTGDGAWIDYSNAGGGGAVPQSAGAFSFTISAQQGPYLGLTDPCYAGLPGSPILYNFDIGFTGNCPDNCIGVTCDDGNPCTVDACNPVDGLCMFQPGTGSCGSANGGKCAGGLCMVEVVMNSGASGNSACAAEGLTCAEIPAITPPEAACLAFNPGAPVTTSASGWREGIYCNDNQGLGCGGRFATCHSCPACLSGGLSCVLTTTPEIERIYASCVP